MLKTIIIRELQEHLKSHTLWLGVLVVTVVTMALAAAHLVDYQERVIAYSLTKDEGSLMGGQQFMKPPEVLSFFARGEEGAADATMHVVSSSLPPVGSEAISPGAVNRYAAARTSDAIDVGFIVAVILSLFVVFFSYDAVSGEKSRGTLRSLVANAIPRHEILLGKVIAGMIVVTLIVAVPIIGATLLVWLNPYAVLTGREFVLIGSLFVLSLIYLTVFQLLSLVVSITIDNTATGLAVLLMIWLIIVHVYPAASVFSVDTLVPNPSVRATAAEKYETHRAAGREMSEEHPDYRSIPRDELTIMSNRGYATALYQYDERQREAREKEQLLAERIGSLSPRVLYRQAVETCARTGSSALAAYQSSVFDFWYREYPGVFAMYVKSKGQAKLHIPFPDEPVTLRECLTAVLWPFFALVGMNMILFTLAFVGFLRKDVR